MPDSTNHQPTSILPKIELAVLLIVVAGIIVLSWQLASDEIKSKIVALPTILGSAISNAFPGKSVKLAETEPTPPPIVTDNIIGSYIPLPPGSQTYKFSNGKDVVGPKISSLTIDPLTPDVGGSQTIEITASYDAPISGVNVEVVTDKNTERQTLQLKSGSNINGTWRGSWTVSDTYESTYGLHLTLTSDRDTYDNTMWFRR